MTSPAYTIGKDELLIVTVEWIDGPAKGSKTNVETDFRYYTAEEVQELIDANCNRFRKVIGVDLYDITAKKGMSIADDFDVRTFAEREKDRRDQEDEEELRYPRVYNARRPSSGNITNAMQGVGAGV